MTKKRPDVEFMIGEQINQLCLNQLRNKGDDVMSIKMNNLLGQYVDKIKEIYGQHLKSVILYGSYARGDYREDSDIDIMILLNITDLEIEDYRHQLSDMTYDFNMDYDVDIKPIAKYYEHFRYWLKAYPFYANVEREGIKLYETA